MNSNPSDTNPRVNVFFPNKTYPKLQPGKGSKDIKSYLKNKHTGYQDHKSGRYGQMAKDAHTTELTTIKNVGSTKVGGKPYEEWLCSLVFRYGQRDP